MVRKGDAREMWMMDRAVITVTYLDSAVQRWRMSWPTASATSDAMVVVVRVDVDSDL